MFCPMPVRGNCLFRDMNGNAVTDAFYTELQEVNQPPLQRAMILMLSWSLRVNFGSLCPSKVS